MKLPPWLVVVTLGALSSLAIVYGEPASVRKTSSMPPMLTGMGRSDDVMDQAWGLRAGQSVDLDVEGERYRMSRLDDGTIEAIEIRPNGTLGRVGHLTQSGDVRFDQFLR
jgi:hypothetical protein